MLPVRQKLSLGLLAITTLKVAPFCVYASFPALLPFFKCILEVVFCSAPPAILPRSLQFCQYGSLSIGGNRKVERAKSGEFFLAHHPLLKKKVEDSALS
jgi:hypothetical protein